GNQYVRGEAAAAMDADAARLEAEIFLAAPADGALAAAHPWVDEADVANADAFRFGSDGDHLADILVAHGQRQLDAAFEQHQPLATADVVIAVPDVQVGMADAGRQHLEDDFCAFRGRRLALHALERSAAVTDVEAEHEDLPTVFGSLADHVGLRNGLRALRRNLPLAVHKSRVVLAARGAGVGLVVSALEKTVRRTFTPDLRKIEHQRGLTGGVHHTRAGATVGGRPDSRCDVGEDRKSVG